MACILTVHFISRTFDLNYIVVCLRSRLQVKQGVYIKSRLLTFSSAEYILQFGIVLLLILTPCFIP